MSDQNQVMLDLETMSTSPSAAIVAIGAVQFGGTIDTDRTFSVCVNLQSCADLGLDIDGQTVMWWLNQSAEARDSLRGISLPICGALKAFADWIPRDALLWGNGSDFDNTILASAFRACGMQIPWKWSNNRCYRTVKNLCPEVELHRSGTHHKALDDARDQAFHLIQCLEFFTQRKAEA